MVAQLLSFRKLSPNFNRLDKLDHLLVMMLLFYKKDSLKKLNT
jgi:hypothetical protein